MQWVYSLANFVAPTVWHEFTPLAASSNAVNLGQGFPGWSPPAFVREAASKAVSEQGYNFMTNQYARSAGNLDLCKALATRYSKSLQHEVDPLTDIVVTDGASEALCTAFLGLCDEGDEVVALEPAFDIYIAQAEMAGATLKTVPLRVKEVDGVQKWTLDMDELKAVRQKKKKGQRACGALPYEGCFFTSSTQTAHGCCLRVLLSSVRYVSVPLCLLHVGFLLQDAHAAVEHSTEPHWQNPDSRRAVADR